VLAAFKKHITANFPELNRERFILACSGGIDSMVLVHLCHTMQLNFVIAHCNFQLRGVDSDLDETFVATTAKD